MDAYPRGGFWICCLLSVCVFNASSSGAEVEKHQPTFTLIVANANQLLSDARDIGAITSQAKLKLSPPDLKHGELEPFGEPDIDRPIVYWFSAKQNSQNDEVIYSTVAAHPLHANKVKGAVSLSKEKISINLGAPKRLEGNDFQKRGEEKRFYRVLEEWVIVAEARDDLEVTPKEIDNAIKGFSPQHRFLFTVNLQNLQDFERDEYIKFILKSGLLNSQLLPIPLSDLQLKIGESLAQYHSQSLAVLRENKSQKIIFQANITAQPDTQLAIFFDEIESVPSRFSSLFDDNADLNVGVSLKLPPSLCEWLMKGIQFGSKISNERADDQKKQKSPEELKAIFQSAFQHVFEKTLKDGRIDFAGTATVLPDQGLEGAYLIQAIDSEKLVEPYSTLPNSRRMDEELGIAHPCVQNSRTGTYFGVLKDAIVFGITSESLLDAIKQDRGSLEGESETPMILAEGRVRILSGVLGKSLPNGWIRDAVYRGCSGKGRFQLEVQTKPRTLEVKLKLDEVIVGRGLSRTPYFKMINQLELIQLFDE